MRSRLPSAHAKSSEQANWWNDEYRNRLRVLKTDMQVEGRE